MEGDFLTPSPGDKWHVMGRSHPYGWIEHLTHIGESHPGGRYMTFAPTLFVDSNMENEISSELCQNMSTFSKLDRFWRPFFVLSRVHSLHFRRFCNAMHALYSDVRTWLHVMSCLPEFFYSSALSLFWYTDVMPYDVLRSDALPRVHVTFCSECILCHVFLWFLCPFPSVYFVPRSGALLLYLTIHCILISCPHHLSCIVLWYTYVEPAMIDWIPQCLWNQDYPYTWV